jgi:hypothetical protein
MPKGLAVLYVFELVHSRALTTTMRHTDLGVVGVAVHLSPSRSNWINFVRVGHFRVFGLGASKLEGFSKKFK